MLSKSVKKLANKIKSAYNTAKAKVAPVVKSALTKAGNALKSSGTASVSDSLGGSKPTTISAGDKLPAAEAPVPGAVRVYDNKGGSSLVDRSSPQGRAAVGGTVTRTTSRNTVVPNYWGNPIQATRSISSGGGTSTQQTAAFAPITMGADDLSGTSSASASTGGGSAGGSGAPSVVSIPTKPLTTDPGRVDNSAFAGMESGAYDFDAETGKFVKREEDTDLSRGDLFDKYFKQKESVYDDREVRRQQREVKKAREAVASYAAQLDSIVAKQNQDLLQLRQTGSQEGVTEAVYGGQALQINREAAIKALPIQASLAAAQGNLELAQEYLSEITAMKKEEIDNEYNYRVAKYNAIEKDVTEKQKEKLDEKKLKEQRAYEEKKEAENIRQELLKSAYSQNAPQSVKNALVKANTVNDMFAAAGEYSGNLQEKALRAMQIRKLDMEINDIANQTNGSADDLAAYAAQYADTGTLPSPSELKLAGLSAGQVTAFAKQIPRAEGSIVSKQTGTQPKQLSANAQEDFARLYNVTKQAEELLKLDKQRWSGVVAGTIGGVLGSDAQGEYLTKRKAIVDEISRMQSGAALTKDEVEFYQDYLPGRFAEPFGIGRDSDKKIENFAKELNEKLNNRLNNAGVAIYGYSKVDVGGKLRTVGEIIDINGEQYRVLPDGTLTDIL